MADYSHLAGAVIGAAREAGREILAVYRRPVDVIQKADNSPLTIADRASHAVIVRDLATTGFPVISEEGETGDCQEPYWLVDPLDGTKDFLAANDEFTVNIALIEGARPIVGVLFAPALDELYVSLGIGQVWREIRGQREIPPEILPRWPPKIAKSRFHDCDASNMFAALNGNGVGVAIGSALKFGRIAWGEIDVYPRFVGTSEWDIAAGDAILTAAGGRAIETSQRTPIRYGKPGRRNGNFIALRAGYQFVQFNLPGQP